MSTEVPLNISWKKNLVFVWLSQYLAMAGFGCCMPFIPLLLRENLHILDDHVRGTYVSIYYLAGMVSLTIAMPVWGALADRFGRKIMLLRASYMAGLSYPLLAFAPNFYVLVLIRFFCSFFSGTVNPAQTLLVTTTPKEKHGFVLGTLSTAIWSGNMSGYLGGAMIVEQYGYKAAFLTCGAIYITSGLLVHLFVKEDFRRVKADKKAKSAEKGIADARPGARQLLTPGVLWILFMVLLMGIARRIEQPFVAMMVEKVHGVNRAAFYTGLTSAAAAAGGILSGIVIGYLCDRIAPRKLAIPVLIVSGAMTFAQALSYNAEMLIVSRFLTYFAAGGIQPILQIILTKITDPRYRGTYFGWFGSMSTAGGIVCSFISGTIAYIGNVRWIFSAAAIIFCLMVPLMIPTIRACKKEFICDPDATAKDLREKGI